MKKTHVIALLAFTIGLNAQQKSTKQSYSYSLNEAIEYALTHNYSAINAARDIDAAKEKNGKRPQLVCHKSMRLLDTKTILNYKNH